MEIASPRLRCEHPDRGLECEEALEAAFAAAIRNAPTAFVDLEHIISEVSSDALDAGWEKEEIVGAVLELGRLYMLNVKRPCYREGRLPWQYGRRKAAAAPFG